MPWRACFSQPIEGQEYSAHVVSVSDGDTITVLHDGRGKKVRLYGVDCPEKKQPFGHAAKTFTADLVFGTTVTVVAVDRDRYGRTVGRIQLEDGRWLDHELVREGYAWWYRKYAPNEKELEDLEVEARKALRGLWAEKDPVPPWDWRKKKRK